MRRRYLEQQSIRVDATQVKQFGELRGKELSALIIYPTTYHRVRREHLLLEEAPIPAPINLKLPEPVYTPID